MNQTSPSRSFSRLQIRHISEDCLKIMGIGILLMFLLCGLSLISAGTRPFIYGGWNHHQIPSMLDVTSLSSIKFLASSRVQVQRSGCTGGEEYFRFKIPHSTRDDNGDFIDDYHQWNRLKALAKKNYPTFYATNSTLKKATLEKAFRAGTLLNSVPVLDVRTIDKKHKHVTFTPTSHVFALHSEVEYENKLSFADAIDSLAREEHSPFEESTNKLIETLKEVGDNSESWNLDLAQLERVRNLPSALRIWAKRSFLQSFVRKHVGASLFWLPKAG